MLVNAAFIGGPGLGPLAAYRLLDLTLGLCLGVCAALLVRGVPVRRVCAAVSGAVAATGPAVAERLRTGSADAGSEGTAWQRTADLWTMHASVPTEEIRSTGTADRLWPVLLSVRRLLSWNVLGGPTTPAPDDGARVGVLAGAARRDLPGSPGLRSALPHPLRTPEPAHDPEAHRRLAALRSASWSVPLPRPRSGTARTEPGHASGDGRAAPHRACPPASFGAVRGPARDARGPGRQAGLGQWRSPVPGGADRDARALGRRAAHGGRLLHRRSTGQGHWSGGRHREHVRRQAATVCHGGGGDGGTGPRSRPRPRSR
ncbi:hypothetical protein SHIRM173S_08766 [Streptomyces hirsutus]